MLMKDVMREKGLVDDSTKTISCPCCQASGLIDSNGDYISPMHHDSKCTFLSACRDMKINPFDIKDDRVLMILKIENLF